jgi:DNA-binding transcriptional regulator YbjK
MQRNSRTINNIPDSGVSTSPCWDDEKVTTAATPKGERRRRALVAAAAELMREGGFDAVRHRAVATRADLPLAATTYYFESLDDLIVAAVEFSGSDELDGMRLRLDGVTHRRRGAESTVDLILDLMVSNGAGKPERDRLISRYERQLVSARRPELRDAQLRLRNQYDDLLADVLRRSGRQVRSEQLRRLAAVVDGALVGALTEIDPDPRKVARGALLEVIDIVAPSSDR